MLRNILVLSLLLKVALAVRFGELTPRYDETDYVDFARPIVEEGAEPSLWRPPLYQWFMAGGMAAAGGRLVLVRIAQAVLSVLATWLAYSACRRIAGARAAIWVAAFLAFYPSHVAFSHWLLTETLYGFLLLLALERLLAADEEGGLGTAAAAGAALGLAALTRSMGLVMLAGAVGWLALGRGRRGVRLGATVALAAALVVAPWSIRASIRAGEPVVTDVNGAFNLWSGNNQYIPPDVQGIWAVGLPLENGLDRRFLVYYPDDVFRREVPLRMAEAGVTDARGPDGAAWYRAQALREIRRDPAGAVRRVPKKLAALWAPDFFLPRHLVRDWYGSTPPSLAATLSIVAWLAAVVPLLLGPATLAALRPSRFRRLAAAWLFLSLLVHAVAFGQSRMHQPLVPILLLSVGAFFLDRDDRPDVRRLIRRGALPMALCVAAWVSVFPLLGGLYVAPGPRHAGMARLLAAGRELPLPGTQRQAWMLATVEASLGRNAEASRMLEGSRHADRAWSWLLRALMAPNAAEAKRLAEEALAREPYLEAAEVVLRRAQETAE